MPGNILPPLTRTFIYMGLLSLLFGCGDSKPGIFSANGYHIGKQKVWYKTSLGMSYTVTELEGADAPTFAVRTLVSKTTGDSSQYGMDKNAVFFGSKKIEGADLATFEFVIGGYSKDKNAVYYMGALLTRDLAHFSVVSRQFVKDSHAVYFGGDVFSDDPAHFEEIGHPGSDYFKDSHQCWYDIYALKNADPATIRLIGRNAAADARRVFREMNEIEGADLKTFQALEYDFSRDARFVYFKNMTLEGVNPATFRAFNADYYADDQHCYYYMNLIPNADPATFQLVDSCYAKDARQVYCNGRVIPGAEPASFRIINGAAGCSCDAHHAYCMEQRIQGVNPALIPQGATCKSCSETGIQY